MDEPCVILLADYSINIAWENEKVNTKVVKQMSGVVFLFFALRIQLSEVFSDISHRELAGLTQLVLGSLELAPAP